MILTKNEKRNLLCIINHAADKVSALHKRAEKSNIPYVLCSAETILAEMWSFQLSKSNVISLLLHQIAWAQIPTLP